MTLNQGFGLNVPFPRKKPEDYRIFPRGSSPMGELPWELPLGRSLWAAAAAAAPHGSLPMGALPWGCAQGGSPLGNPTNTGEHAGKSRGNCGENTMVKVWFCSGFTLEKAWGFPGKKKQKTGRY